MLIAEAILLILLEPASGAIRLDPIRLETVLGGALTADLELAGLLSTDTSGPFGNRRVTAVAAIDGRGSAVPLALRDDILIRQGVSIAAARRHNGPRLVGKLARDVRVTVLQRFVDQGIVRFAPERRWLGLVSLGRWPVIDPSPIDALHAQLYAAIIARQEPDAHTRWVIALLHCLDITHKVVPLGDLSRADVRARCQELTGKHWITTAVRALVAAQMPG